MPATEYCHFKMLRRKGFLQFQPESGLQHALKKVLVAGKRGAKDEIKDIEEAILTLQRKLEMIEEDNNGR